MTEERKEANGHARPLRAPLADGAAPGEVRPVDTTATEAPALSLPAANDIEQLVRARGPLFLVTDRDGDINPPGARELGLFHRDTRHLSHYELSVENGTPVRLSSETTRDGYNQIDLMLKDLEAGVFLDDPKNFLHIRRRQMLDGGLIEQVVFTSFLRRPVDLRVTLAFGADFADIFEVRGARRPRRGVTHPASVSPDAVELAYDGLCGRKYTTRLRFSVAPTELTARSATFDLRVVPRSATTLEIHVDISREGERADGPTPPMALAYTKRAERLHHEAEAFREASTRWSCDNGRLQQMLDQSTNDLYALRIPVGDHHIVGAGIPWFCAPFGRDALITAYEALTLNRDIGIDALRTLAAFQGTKFDAVSEEEPGKIFHELRFGEMARAKEIPHSPYYGSIDATPLFVIVADAVHRFTADKALLRQLKPHIIAALGWIDTQSASGTRLVAYEKKSPLGLENQGWKDSRAGVSFPDGRPAEPPIALCEVQGYCIDAYARGARVLLALGEDDLAKTYEARADKLRDLVDREMWLDDCQRYAFAIDGRGQVLDTVVSNLGHLLWSRLPNADRALATARVLLAPESFSGFGIRTLASNQAVYNPLSYHNGTVWPHDNALIARGLQNYNLGEYALKIFDGMYAASSFLRDHRFPELFCGIGAHSGPLVRYPVACSPQAWAAAAPFLLLQSILGLSVDAPRQRLTIRNPRLPDYVRKLEFRSMRIGKSLVSMRFRRVGGRCHVDRLDVTGAALKTEIEID